MQFKIDNIICDGFCKDFRRLTPKLKMCSYNSCMLNKPSSMYILPIFINLNFFNDIIQIALKSSEWSYSNSNNFSGLPRSNLS